MSNIRENQIAVEVMVGETANVRLDQVVAEVMVGETANVRLNQLVIEVWANVASSSNPLPTLCYAAT